MRTLKNTAILAVILLSALAGCRKAEWESAEGKVTITNPNPPERRANFVTFNASLEGEFSATRTSLDLELTRKLTWEKGDQVLIEDEDGKQAIYTAESGGSDATTLVRVSGDTLKTSGSYTAWYPVSYKEDGLQSETWYEDRKSLRGGPMRAEGMKTLEFKNICGVVRCSYNPTSNIVVKKLVLSAAQPLCPTGNITCDLSRKSPSGMSIYATGKNFFSFFIPAGTYSELRATFSRDDETLADITLEYDIKVTAGNILDVDLNTPQGKLSNLNKHESANCYVLSGPGEYFFTPTLGPSGLPVEGMTGVSVLWQTDNTDGELDKDLFEALSFDGGKIYFTIPENYTPGNFLLAGTDDGGNVLWSWHIWAAESIPGVQQYDTAGKFMLMDRSLGSLAAPTLKKPSNDKYACLLYQWGRKDPFPGYCTQGDRYRMEVRGTSTAFVDGPGDIATATAHPETYFKGDSLWCSDAAAVWTVGAKSNYDPCPPTYRVADPGAFNETTGPFYTEYIGVTCISSGGAYVFQRGDEWYGYPLSSCILGMTGAKGSKSNNYIWTSAPVDGDKTALCCSMSYGIPEGSTSKHPLVTLDDPTPRSNGCSVRCMRIIEEQ